MNRRPSESHRRLRDWAASACDEGWLDPAHRDALDRVETPGASALFAAGPRRPLVVGFFGGTGVGKSSLLNRIAGHAVARVGVERPTSHEVTFYVHESVALAELPSELPVDQTRIARHRADSWQDVVWVDAPDLDSVEEKNRRLALAWLPHLDLLVYVISPERYRDDVGWRVLMDRRERHGWIFVLNRADEASPQQLDDLRRILARAGFESPLIFPTVCSPAAAHSGVPDRFDDFARTIEAVRDANGGQELQRQAERAHAAELKSVAAAWLSRFGTPALWDQVRRDLSAGWTETTRTIADGGAYAVRIAAGRFAVRSGGFDWARHGVRLLSRLRDPRTGADDGANTASDAPHDRAATPPLPTNVELRELVAPIWDAWSDGKLAVETTRLEIALRERGIAPGPALRAAEDVLETAGDVARAKMEDHLRRALAEPGTRWQRIGRRITGFLTPVLPTLALCWVAYSTVTGFHRGVSGQADFFGTNFLISAAMLVFVAWAVPFALDQYLRPSLERSAQAAIERGRALAMEEVGAQLEIALRSVADRAAALQHELREHVESLERTAETRPAPLPDTLRPLLAAVRPAESAKAASMNA
jgi:hypothetical protein